MKRFFILFFLMAVTLTGCDQVKQKPSAPAPPQQAYQPEATAEKPKAPLSVGDIEGKLSEIKNKLKNTEEVLIKRTAERDTVKTELGQLIRRSNKTPKEIKTELTNVNSELDSQLWFQEIRSAWSKLVALERDVVIFTRQEERLNKSRIQLEQSLGTLKRIEENNSVYIKGEDPELDRLIAEGDVITQEGEWEELTSGEKTEIALEVDKIMTETIENNISKIPGLELKSVKALSPLPDIAANVQEPETSAQKSLLGRVKNDCNQISEHTARVFAEYLEEKQLEAACNCRLEAIQQIKENITSAMDSFAPGFFRDYLSALKACQNDTLLALSRPYLQALSQCVKDLESKDPDWKTIAESLEGLLRIKPPLQDSDVETQLEIIRSHFDYLLKKNDRDAQITQARLKPILDEMDKYAQEQFAARHYSQSLRFLKEKKFSEADEEIRLVLEKYPGKQLYVRQREQIGKAEEEEEKNLHFNQSVEFLEKKQFKEALDEIVKLLAREPDNEKFVKQKKLIEHTVLEDKAGKNYDQAVRLFKKKEYSKALAEINLALALCPTNSDFLKQKEKILELLPKAGDRKVFTVDGVEFAFRWCPAGEFIRENRSDLFDTKPHKVKLTQGFWLLETEVTQEMWEKIMGRSLAEQKKLTKYDTDYGEGDQYPVYYVNWDESVDFCRKLSKKWNRFVQLPTEAQWEYACRAGVSEISSGEVSAMAWHRFNSNWKTHEVGKKQPNAWGLYDMYGNVEEWCLDWYDKTYYAEAPECDPENMTGSITRVVRGGSCQAVDMSNWFSFRFDLFPDHRYNVVGFRVLILPGPEE